LQKVRPTSRLEKARHPIQKSWKRII